MSRYRSVTESTAPADSLASFTVDRANRALVLVRRIVADIVGEYPRVADLQEAAEAACAAGNRTHEAEARKELVGTIDRLHTCLEELDDVGAELKDFQQGVVDFPCVIDGEHVCLCWRHGEARIEHWHELGAGFAERQPIAFLPVEAAPDAVATSSPDPPRTSAWRR